MPSSMFLIAWFRLLILLRIPSEIASPAASSPARTIRQLFKGLFQLSCFDPLISGSIYGCYVILHLHDVSPSFVSSMRISSNNHLFLLSAKCLILLIPGSKGRNCGSAKHAAIRYLSVRSAYPYPYPYSSSSEDGESAPY